MQLLAKDPADRFPNTQVLARHLQAMAMALSRPASDDFSLASDHPAIERAAADVNQSIAIEATQADADGMSLPNGRPAKDDAIRNPTAPASQNAATLDADEVLSKQSSEIVGSTIAPSADLLRAATPARPTRFTTIEEEEALRCSPQHRSWLVMAGQLAALAVVLGAIGGIAWHLSQPPSADKLYSSVMARIDADDVTSLVRAENELNEFLTRYPEDPRAAEFERYRVRIELDKFERKLQRRTRGSAATDPSLLPVEQLYLRAAGMADTDPDKALAMFASLVNLYGTGALPVDSAGGMGATSRDDPERDAAARTSNIVQQAHRRIGTLRADLDRQRERELAALNERLDAGDKLSKTDSGAAAAIYQAIIDLHQGDTWAESAIKKAHSRLAKIKK